MISRDKLLNYSDKLAALVVRAHYVVFLSIMIRFPASVLVVALVLALIYLEYRCARPDGFESSEEFGKWDYVRRRMVFGYVLVSMLIVVPAFYVSAGAVVLGLPLVFAIMAVVAALFVFLRLGIQRAAQVLLVAGWLYLLYRAYTSHSAAVISITSGGSVLLLAARFFSLESLRRLPSWHIVLSALFVILMAEVFFFLFSRLDRDPRAVLTQPALEAVYVYDDDDPLGDLFERYKVRKVLDGCSPGVYYITADYHGGLWEYHADSGESRMILLDELHGVLEIDCDRKQLYAGNYDGGDGTITILDAHGLWTEVRKVIPVSIREHLNAVYAPDKRLMFIVNEDSQLSVVDLDHYKELRTASNIGTRIDYTGDMLLAHKAGTLKVFRFAKDFEPLMMQNVWLPTWSAQTEIAVDRELPLVYVTEFNSGELYALNYSTGTYHDRMTLAPGIRYIELSRDHKWIGVVNHMTGEFHLIDRESFTLRHTLNIGKRGRRIYPSEQSDRFLVASVAGAFMINLDKLPPPVADVPPRDSSPSPVTAPATATDPDE